ncbi:VOC family protein [Paraburkholderia tropica]|uniref:VOC family protein n=1 Tax=Paraburkholderia tropica TaxID=92647 RepID=UPI0007EC3E97|nr:VOC family protein [Paraburkholderia tropica]OBR46309.1 hypothetical protein A6456_29755 [Paraburkholderia tropica]
MIVFELFHVAIKTADLDATVNFYTKVVGLKNFDRPAFKFPGAWLGTPGPTGKPIIHVYAGEPALAGGDSVAVGTAAIDHVSFSAVGYHDVLENVKKYGIDWRENEVPGGKIWQFFIYDPNGVMLEFTFDGTREVGEKPDMSPERAYKAGESFFNPESYNSLTAAYSK